MSDAELFVAEVIASMEADLGHPLGDGTVVVSTEDRGESPAVVVYPLAGPRADRLALWCSPVGAAAVAAAGLGDSDAADLEAFIAAAESTGAEVVGRGRNLTLADGAFNVSTVDGFSVQILSRDDESHVAMMQTLVDVLSEDDLEESELDIDDLDPRLLVLVDDDTGTVTAFASGLPADGSLSFDDIGVAVHPEYRRRGLGAAVVAAYVDEYCVRGDRKALYRHDVENRGSARLAEAVGFEPVHTIGAVMWPESD